MSRGRTALHAPESALDPNERDFVAKVREHGWHAMHIFEDEEGPGFSYTTGFFVTLGAPEVIVFGLSSETAQAILWDLYRDLMDYPVGAPVSEVLGNADACFMPVSKANYPEYLGWSRWFYGGDGFPCLQLVWPDRAGLFPWQAGWDETMGDSQPDLSPAGWAKALKS